MGTDRILTPIDEIMQQASQGLRLEINRAQQLDLIKAIAETVAAYVPNDRGADGLIDNLMYISGEIMARLEPVKHDAD